MADPAVAWYNELDQLSLTDGSTSEVVVTPSKTAGFTVLSNELVDDSDPAIAEQLFHFTDEPHKVQILTQACRVADIVAELDEAADEAPLTVKGSMGQVVISPFIAKARAQRALLAQLIGRLGLPDTDEIQAEQSAKPSRTRRHAAKGNRS